MSARFRAVCSVERLLTPVCFRFTFRSCLHARGRLAVPPGRHVVGTLDLRRAIPRLRHPQLLRAAASTRGRHSSRHGRDVCRPSSPLAWRLVAQSRLLRVLRHAPAATADGAPAPNPDRFGGHRRDASHVHHMPVGRVGAQPYPGGIATRYRNTARGLDRPNRKRSAETIPNSNRDRAPHTAHSRQFRGCSCVSGLLTLIRLLDLSALLPHPARWRRTVARSSGAAPVLRRTSGIRLPLSFTRPLRRPGARSLTPPGHMAPRGAVLVSRTTGTARGV